MIWQIESKEIQEIESANIARQYSCTEYYKFIAAPNADTPHPMHELYRYKSRFGGRFFHRMGCWDYPPIGEDYKVLKP